jgi:hypothetical protein
MCGTQLSGGYAGGSYRVSFVRVLVRRCVSFAQMMSGSFSSFMFFPLLDRITSAPLIFFFFRFCLERDLLLHVDEHSRSTWGLEETTFFPSQKGTLLLLFFRCFPYLPPLTDVPFPFRVAGEDPIQNWIISSCHVM